MNAARPDDSRFTQALQSQALRGLYSAHVASVGVMDEFEISEFIDRSGSGAGLRAVADKAKLKVHETCRTHLAVFGDRTPYIHSYKNAYSRSWSIGVVFAAVPSGHDQVLLSSSGLNVQLLADGRSFSVRYCDMNEIQIPVEPKRLTSVFVGYTGAKLRLWKNHDAMQEVDAPQQILAASNLIVGSDRKGNFPWCGFFNELAVYARYEPASNEEIPRIWADYAYHVYGEE